MDTKTTPKLTVEIRWMVRRDMPTVLEIEHAAYGDPWSEEDFVRCLGLRNCIGMVAEYDEEVVGYMIYELEKPRIHVSNFIVSPAYLRRGIGSQMANKLKAKLGNGERRNRISLEIDEHNLLAQVFFRSQGFTSVQILRNHFHGEVDAYQFQYEIAKRYKPNNRIKVN